MTAGQDDPIWSPDGRYIAYDKIGVGIYRKPANGAGDEELLLPSKILAVPKSWSRDGRFIARANQRWRSGFNGDSAQFSIHDVTVVSAEFAGE